jgi:hypothetical protein
VFPPSDTCVTQYIDPATPLRDVHAPGKEYWLMLFLSGQVSILV